LLELFTRHKDTEAFTVLVERHGPMVLGVCQRVLHHEQEAEDAFQATFLELVRKAGSLRHPELLGNWLYGVALRIALKARLQTLRRRYHERQIDALPAVDPFAEVHGQELRALIEEELQYLPAKYRAPLVLCYLEGLTNEEAARRLGWPTGSISYRLARGRQLLRDRLLQVRTTEPQRSREEQKRTTTEHTEDTEKEERRTSIGRKSAPPHHILPFSRSLSV
jgi:RNA polymerase sigma factor (sigma-70 family)